MYRDRQKRKLKICLAVTLPTWGGAQHYTYDLTKAFSDEYEIVVAAGQGPNKTLLDKIGILNVTTHQFKYLVREISPIKDFLAIFEMRKFFFKNRFDIVHLNSSKAGVIGAIAAKLAGVNKVIYTAHGFVFNEDLNFLKRFFYVLLELISFLFTDKIITVSEFDAKSVLKFHLINKNKVKIIHNGINNEDLNFKSKEESRNFFEKLTGRNLSAFKIICSISNLFDNKGINYLIDAADKLLQKNNNIFFIVIGEGPSRTKLEKLIAEKHIENNFCLAGFVEKPEKYLKGIDLYISSSLKEGLPYSLIYVLNAGVPAVSTDAGGSREIIEDNISGLIVPKKDYQKIAGAVSSLIDNTNLYTKLSNGTFVSAKKFSLDLMLDKTRKVYEEQ